MGTSDDTGQDENLGRVLANQYCIDALLGHGGMGSVYRGRQLSIQRPVAIKLIAGSIASNEECIKRFRREAEAMAMLHHPNTVRLFDFGVDSEQSELFMVMELLEGEDLADHLTHRGALPLPEALTILREVLQALSEAHARGIVHRDLKPANVFMSKVHGGQVFAKVMDFGIAGIEADANTKLTLAGAVLGTPTYMSPEQAQGQPVDARSDLYSLGVVLFEMVTGRVPFAADSVVSLLLAQVSKPPPRLSEVHPALARSTKLQALLDRLLAKSPDQRPRDAAEVLSLVAELERDLASGVAPTELGAAPVASAGARPPSQVATALDASHAAVRAAPSLPQGPRAVLRRHERGPRELLIAGAALLVALIALIALWPKAEDEDAGPPATTSAPVAKVSPEVPREPEGRAVTAKRARAVDARGEEREPAARARSEDESADEQTGSGAAADTPPSTSAGGGARPFPRLQRALDKVFGTSEGGRGESQSERRQALLARGPAYNNVAAAKRAYRAGQLSEQAYEDTIWVLKTRRARRIEAEEQNLRAGAISKEEYKRRVTRIDQEYAGS